MVVTACSDSRSTWSQVTPGHSIAAEKEVLIAAGVALEGCLCAVGGVPTAACSTARPSDSRPSAPARSTNVRDGVVQGTPSWTVTSSGPGIRQRWARMPSSLRPVWQGTITSINTGSRSRNPHRAAALRCEITDPDPQARTAARSWPWLPIVSWPTA